MLQNAYFLAKIGADTDTAENDQHFADILPKIGNYPTGRRLDHSTIVCARRAAPLRAVRPELLVTTSQSSRDCEKDGAKIIRLHVLREI